MFSFLLLLDTSGSMQSASGEKIQCLNLTTSNFIAGLKSIAPEIHLAIITIGGFPALTNFAPVKEITPATYQAKGSTPLTEAVILAKNIVNKTVITVLISDGAPNDGQFTKMTLGGPIYAIQVGFDANYEELARFTGCPNRVFRSYDSEAAAGYILQREH